MIDDDPLASGVAVIYLMTTMTLGTLSICMTVVVLNFHHRGPQHAVPVRLRRLILFHLARLVRVDTAYRTSCRKQPVWKRRKYYDGGHRQPFRNAAIDGLEFLSLTAKSNSHHVTHHPPPPPPPPPSTGNGILTSSENGGNDVQTYSRLTWRSSIYAKTMDGGGGGDHHNHQHHQHLDQSTTEWREMAHVLDRAFFWLICVLMTSSATFILLYPKYMGMEDVWYTASDSNT